MVAREDYTCREGASDGTAIWAPSVLFVHESHTNQQLNTHHTDGVLKGQDLPSSLVLVGFGQDTVLRVRNNAAAAGQMWDVGVVLLFVFLQFS